MKKNVLFMVAALLLCGAVSAQNWGTPDAHAKSSNTPIVAKVQLDGADIDATSDMRLGAFVGTELRGIAAPHTDGNFWIQAFYNANETPLDAFTFKFYDGEQEYTNCSTSLTGQDKGYGTPNAPQVLNFTSTQTMTQTTELASGWNWWSSYIELGSDALTLLETGLNDHGNQILSRTDGFVNRNEYAGYVYWSGSLRSICNEQMYKIQTIAPCDVNITGQRASASSHPITINQGWNWIGYPNAQSMSITDALQGFNPEPNDQIKGRNGYATYTTYQSYGWWSGSLSTLEPGQGYMYNSNSSSEKTLVYHSGRYQSPKTNITPVDNIFIPNVKPYASNMTITAIVELEGDELHTEGYEVAAFAGNECRGSAKLIYVEPLDRYMVFLLVAGDTEHNLRFALTDGYETSWSEDNVMYSNDDIIGTPMEPAVLHFGPLGINEDKDMTVNVYPNPSNDVYNIVAKDIQRIEVIDNLGQIILSKEIENDFVQISLNGRTNGAYLLRVVTSNGVFINKLIKK